MPPQKNEKEVTLPLVIHDNFMRYFFAPLAASIAVLIGLGLVYATFSDNKGAPLLGILVAMLFMLTLIYFISHLAYIFFNQGMKISKEGIEMWNVSHSFTPIKIKWEQVSRFEYKPNKIGVLYPSIVLKDQTWYQLPQMEAVPNVPTDLEAEDTRFAMLSAIHKQMIPNQPQADETSQHVTAQENQNIRKGLRRRNRIIAYSLLALFFLRINDSLVSRSIAIIFLCILAIDLIRGWRANRTNRKH